MTDWKCKYCKCLEIRDIDLDPETRAMSVAIIKEHMSHHGDQLAEHDGDPVALKARLQNPVTINAVNETKEIDNGGTP